MLLNEKITLETKSAKHRGFKSDFDSYIIVVILTIVLTCIITFCVIFVPIKYNTLASMSASVLIFIFMMIQINKDNAGMKEVMYYIYLKALDNVEKYYKKIFY